MLLLAAGIPHCGPTTPALHCYNTGLGCSPFARHYWGNHCCFLFLEVLRCFSSLRLPPHHMMRIITLQVIGLSHSEIRGSRDICSYPRLIAAYHVLHRLREPRHPPCALFYFRAVKPYIYNICRPCRSSACPCRTYNIYGRRLVYCFVFNFNLQSCLCQHVKDRCPDICRAGGE